MASKDRRGGKSTGNNNEDEKRGRRKQTRAPGEGTKYQDKHGNWFVAVGSGKNRIVKRVPKAQATSKGVGEALKALVREYDRREDQLDQNLAARHDDHRAAQNRKGPGSDLTVLEYANDWLNNIVGPNLKPSTKAKYRHKLEDMILPYLGTITLSVLEREPIRVQRWLEALRGAGFAPSTIKDAYTIGSNLMSDAEIHGIQSNPFIAKSRVIDLVID